MSKRNGHLKFDAAKHDALVEGIQQAEREHGIRKAQAHAGKLIDQDFKSTKAIIKAEAVEHGKIAVPRIVQLLYEFMHRAGKTLEHTPDSGNFHRNIMQQVEDLISATIATNGGLKNQIHEYVSQEALKNEHALTVPESAVFATLEELAEIKWVKPYTLMDGFVGFVRNGRWVKAFYKPVAPLNQIEIVRVGLCVCSTVIVKLPTEDQVREELEKGRGK